VPTPQNTRIETIAPRTAEYQDIGAWIRKQREKAGLSQREVSRSLGKNQSFMYRVERGEQRIDLLQFFDLIELLSVDKTASIDSIIKAIKMSW
jgi:transcriptional regulator with XRE-family HTH domain